MLVRASDFGCSDDDIEDDKPKKKKKVRKIRKIKAKRRKKTKVKIKLSSHTNSTGVIPTAGGDGKAGVNSNATRCN